MSSIDCGEWLNCFGMLVIESIDKQYFAAVPQIEDLSNFIKVASFVESSVVDCLHVGRHARLEMESSCLSHGYSKSNSKISKWPFG